VKVSILSVGASTAVGLSAEQTAFGLRAALFCPLTIRVVDEDGRQLGAAIATSVVEEVEGWERMVWLALPALREALGAAPPAGTSRVRRLFLALPMQRAGFDDADRRSVVEELGEAVLDGVPITVVTGQNEAFGRALALATRHVAEHPSERVAVGAVDSRHAAATYAELDADFRLLSERAPDGFVPGEGAAFVVIGSHADGALASLVYADAADEEPGAELDAAFTDLVERGAASIHANAKEPSPLPWILVDQRSERHRSRSWSRVEHRLSDLLDASTTTVDALSERLGDAGTASGAILCVYAAIGLESGFGPGSRGPCASALVALGSDAGGRACFAMVPHLAAVPR